MMEVRGVKNRETHQWLLKRHYAKRIPSISHAFGLYNDMSLIGVVTYGMPPNYVEMKAWEPYQIIELNRLVVEDCSPKNSASVLVGRSIKMLPSPCVVISYADFRMGHVGYIYQATNWVYTGVGGEGHPIYIMKDGSERHPHHEKDLDMGLVDHVEKTMGKHRYYFFHGNKKEKADMEDKLRFPSLPYPKGDTSRYDASGHVEKQGILF